MATMSCTTGRLAGKRCLVTAAAQGIGRAAVDAFLKEGAALVVAVDVNAEKLKELSSDRVERRVLDVKDVEGLKALARDYQEIDVLFNCVGNIFVKTFLEITEQEWDNCFAVNVKSTFLLSQAFIPQMISRGGGSIINMSSVASSVRGFGRRSAYGAAKAAVIGLTKNLAREYVRQGIRCNVVCPSPTDTPGLIINVEDLPASEKELQHHIMNNLTGRLAKPQDIANLCVYLASDESSYHTGNVFVIDGGFTL